MTAAVEATTADLDPALAGGVRDALLGYFNPAAESLRNDTGLPISAPSDRR